MVDSPPQAALDLYDVLRRRGLATSLLVSREWRAIDPSGDWLAEWQTRIPRANAIVSAARIGAAGLGAESVPLALAQSGFPEPQDALVNPRAFAGWAWQGVRMDDYLTSPVIVARRATGSADEMLATGGRWLDGLVRTAVTDAGRSGSGLAIMATKNAGYVRYEPAPYCQRCAVLVGKWFKANTGFQRHPRCDAVHVAQSSRAPEGERYQAVLDPAQIHDLTDAQRKAIEDGADLNRVLNAYRAAKPGTYETMATTAELSRAATRLTPEAIYAAAGDDRNRALNMLRHYGYYL